MDFLAEYHIAGIVVGIISFLIIGVFHPLVIKGEYYFGKKCRWWFLGGGIISMACSILSSDIMVSILTGVLAFSCFWSILEVSQQEERVRKGWFPRNPKRTYWWDK